MRVAVVGSGYVGLVTSACLAESGNDVVAVDVDTHRIEKLNRAELPIFEPGLQPLVASNLAAGRLEFTTEMEKAVPGCDVAFISVGTPGNGDGSADLTAVLEVASEIGDTIDRETVVVTKSTVPVGTAKRVEEAIESRTDIPVHVCSNPEFLKEGSAVEDFMRPDRVVLGVDSEFAEQVLESLYAPFVRANQPIVVTDVATAEISKYAANAMLATRISFMNSIAKLCDRTGADVDMVRKVLGSDSRIGGAFLYPGVGYGGSCFPKDVRALARTFERLGVDPSLLHSVDQINENQKHLILESVVDHFGEDLTGLQAAVWGLAFKPNTDDLREAPSLVTIDGLLDRGAKVVVHDPAAMRKATARYGDRIGYANSDYEAVADADFLAIHTEWQPYRQLDFDRMLSLMRRPVIFDGRNLFDPHGMESRGFEYWSVGRRTAGQGGKHEDQ